jgi:hypothetical protein
MVNFATMKKAIFIIIIVVTSFVANSAIAQCSVCTKTASQLGEKPAKGMNSGILYLMAAPFVFAGYIGYRWWKTNR